MITLELVYKILVPIVGIIYAVTFAILLKRRALSRVEDDNNKGKADFYRALITGLKRGTVTKLADVENIYKGILNIGNETQAYRSELAKWLREFLVYIVADNNGSPTYYHLKLYNLIVNNEFSNEDAIKHKEFVDQMISENESIAPFSDLPDTERAILSDIATYAKSDGNDRIFEKLNTLASTIKTKENAIQRIESLNKMSLPLAIIGMVLTIVFGILPFFIPIGAQAQTPVANNSPAKMHP